MYDPMHFLGDHIHGDKFAYPKLHWNDRGKNLEGLAYGGLVFCKTDYIQELFDMIRGVDARYILVTHNSDHNIDETRYSWKPNNITTWFAQNVVVDKPDLIPIPIGCERPDIAGSGNIDDFIAVASQKIGKDALAYVNWSDSTNSTRGNLKSSLSWCDVTPTRIPFKEFLGELTRHDFTISPPGNGSDVHRTWEALYCGSIPVCEANPHNKFFARILPISLYSSITDITPEFLLEEKKRVLAQLESGAYTLEALRFSWWQDLINFYTRYTCS